MAGDVSVDKVMMGTQTDKMDLSGKNLAWYMFAATWIFVPAVPKSSSQYK